MQTKLLTLFAIAAFASVKGMPFVEKRDATATTSTAVVAPTSVPSVASDALEAPPAFVNADGTEDIAGLWAAFDAVPDLVEVPDMVSNVTVVASQDALDTIAAAQTANVINSAATDGSDDGSSGSVQKRQTSSHWAGYATCGPKISSASGLVIKGNDTRENFETYAPYTSSSKSAVTPQGYVSTLTNGLYSFENNNANVGNYEINAYKPSLCSAKCDGLGVDSTGAKICNSFTMYYERDPSIVIKDFENCGNPPSMTRIGCQLWSARFKPKTDTDPGTVMNSGGQWAGNYFYVAKTGVNAYTRTDNDDGRNVDVKGFNSSVVFPNGKIDNQKVAGNILFTYIYKGQAYNPNTCANAASKYGTKAKSFETWRAVRGGVEYGQGCIVLGQANYTSADANDAGQWYNDANTGASLYSGSTPVYYYASTL